MTTAVLLAFADGSKEFVREAHVHGLRDGHLLLAAGAPGAGLDAEVVRAVPAGDLSFAETCVQDNAAEDADGSDWSISLPDD